MGSVGGSVGGSVQGSVQGLIVVSWLVHESV